ncbi:hypothetical protein F1559_004812 [Cyanidiococcus yangmingshanensis]|uniref:Uncharacterized protein n=1 Tax=Cyanidiococcus yangmingshanensis TaxID=2690220 RepID=A0A7J7IPF1_9RHOD|nr:hypothetical protein F1559_004812 [Cyanidiococcus yangmingshanensis]
MDCTYTREPEPWECTDGALYLWRHLAQRGCGERCAENGILVLILVRLIELPVFHRLPALWATLWTQFALALPYLPPHTVQELLPTIRESMAKTAQCEQQHVLIALDEMKRDAAAMGASADSMKRDLGCRMHLRRGRMAPGDSKPRQMVVRINESCRARSHRGISMDWAAQAQSGRCFSV